MARLVAENYTMLLTSQVLAVVANNSPARPSLFNDTCASGAASGGAAGTAMTSSRLRHSLKTLRFIIGTRVPKFCQLNNNLNNDFLNKITDSRNFQTLLCTALLILLVINILKTIHQQKKQLFS